MGIDLEGQKDLLGLWIFDTESAKGWLSVLTELKNRGVVDILILTSDGLTGIQEAVQAAYPQTLYQGCVVHVIRNSVKYVSSKHQKAFCADLKAIYTAPTEEAALMAYQALCAKWGEKDPLAVAVWERNWERIATLFAFTPEIRRLRNTTNPTPEFQSTIKESHQKPRGLPG